jgi:hypothetical protein
LQILGLWLFDGLLFGGITLNLFGGSAVHQVAHGVYPRFSYDSITEIMLQNVQSMLAVVVFLLLSFQLRLHFLAGNLSQSAILIFKGNILCECHLSALQCSTLTAKPFV